MARKGYRHTVPDICKVVALLTAVMAGVLAWRFPAYHEDWLATVLGLMVAPFVLGLGLGFLFWAVTGRPHDGGFLAGFFLPYVVLIPALVVVGTREHFEEAPTGKESVLVRYGIEPYQRIGEFISKPIHHSGVSSYAAGLWDSVRVGAGLDESWSFTREKADGTSSGSAMPEPDAKAGEGSKETPARPESSNADLMGKQNLAQKLDDRYPGVFAAFYEVTDPERKLLTQWDQQLPFPRNLPEKLKPSELMAFSDFQEKIDRLEREIENFAPAYYSGLEDRFAAALAKHGLNHEQVAEVMPQFFPPGPKAITIWNTEIAPYFRDYLVVLRKLTNLAQTMAMETQSDPGRPIAQDRMKQFAERYEAIRNEMKALEAKATPHIPATLLPFHPNPNIDRK
jgi:uncharacterized protein (UPF0335 family)